MDQSKTTYFKNLANLLRYDSLLMTTRAGSGHLTSALSAADLMAVLFFDKFKFDFENPQNSENDRLIFSKGHASPLLYSLYHLAGEISDQELLNYRQLGSPLEGHPTPAFPYVEVATGSLGQGLSVGVGMALAAKYLDKTKSRIYVLLGDGEMAEGSVWEAIEMASYYKLGNLTGIIDVNRLGQSQETMIGHKMGLHQKRIAAFDWGTTIVNGHDFGEISQAFDWIQTQNKKPTMIIAKTIKGKGISFLEDRNGWHGKALSEEEAEKAKKELGVINFRPKSVVKKPNPSRNKAKILARPVNFKTISYQVGEKIATRKAFGEALRELIKQNRNLVILDGDVKNSTYTEFVDKAEKTNFFEMFIAEQNLVGAAAGLAARGKIPVVATFAAFLTRAFDQIRMNAISQLNIKYVGTHAGVSIGQDGPSQMGLEDLAMFRSIFQSVVLYPADGIATAKLSEEMVNHKGIVYLRLARPETPIIYEGSEKFTIGGSKILVESKSDRATIIAAGVTVFEALEAQKELAKEGINIRVIDCYSLKPIDGKTLMEAAKETGGKIVTVEDHWFDGGLGDTVLNVFAQSPDVKIYKLAISKMPHSGKPAQNLRMAGIDAQSIIKKVKEILRFS